MPLNPFTPRTGHCSTKVDNNNIYIFGGQNFQQNKHYDDFLHFDLGFYFIFLQNNFLIQKKEKENSNIRKINKQQKTLNINQPTERNSSAMCYNYIDNQIILFGGADSQEPLNDLFIYDLGLQQWKKAQISNINDHFKGLEMHSIHFYTTNGDLKAKKKKKKKNNNIVGLDIGDFTKETNSQGQPIPHENLMKITKVNIEFDDKNAVFENQIESDNKQEENNETQQLQEQEEEEQKIEEQKNENQQKYLIIIGGREHEKIKNEIYALNLQSFHIKKFKEMPFGLCAHTSVIVNDLIYIFGGTNGLEFFDKFLIFSLSNYKFYEFDISDSEKKKKIIKPRMASSMSYDPVTKNICVFGGAGFDDECSTLICFNVDEYNLTKRVIRI
ncbi:kelch motif family protein, putative [Ichthyophthirius multifiliis]|uniref:Kelch motif family protein, putative n=1 Tax=Ichthyophthirius multifiliis TaxID=5932 RepID=G0QZ44_ICHMU|nr:kelch motif family protein, putative [Ichthyophthirius multifiliis]EGR29511.1 kelch motif family protein, putative [Ichthyophthirius multifiliis]|eukprot:XP_004030747.1 kelch motif family protein, putative [Ichthyophthirius multifiliis]